MGGRSQRACEILSGEGFTSLVNMHGGLHGARDMAGSITEPGWEACGYPTESGPCAERGYDALKNA